MMMAHDSSPGRGSLSEETIEAVRAALLGYIDAPAHGERLGRALHAMAAEAREEMMLPEQLLVILKDIWYSLPGVRAMKDSAEQVRLLQRVVTMCIREYYAD
jgi:hypothetical protein